MMTVNQLNHVYSDKPLAARVTRITKRSFAYLPLLLRALDGHITPYFPQD
jgi:hypothetical protein